VEILGLIPGGEAYYRLEGGSGIDLDAVGRHQLDTELLQRMEEDDDPLPRSF
jgi:hypothetical protein